MQYLCINLQSIIIYKILIRNSALSQDAGILYSFFLIRMIIGTSGDNVQPFAILFSNILFNFSVVGVKK